MSIEQTSKILASDVVNSLSEKAPTSHASNDITYGIGTETSYGHVKLSDSTTSTSSASSGTAASSKAVSTGLDLLMSDIITAVNNVGVGDSSSSIFQEIISRMDNITLTKADKFVNNKGVIRSVNGLNANEEGDIILSIPVTSVNGMTGNVNIVTFPAGTKMLFNQSAAPTGWTKQTSINDSALRVVSGDGGGTGGSLAFSTLFATGKAVSLSGNVGATTLTAAQMPSHRHKVVHTQSAYYNTYGYDCMYTCGWKADGTSTGQYKDQAVNSILNTTGSSSSHTHTLAGTATISLAVKYTDVIICAKD